MYDVIRMVLCTNLNLKDRQVGDALIILENNNLPAIYK